MTGPEQARSALGVTAHPARAVACPRCGARPYAACTAPSGRRLTAGPHPARITAWTNRKDANQP